MTSPIKNHLTLRQLRAFVFVAETGRFTLAADAMHTSQSALSGMIQELEDQLNAKLFDRTTRSVHLTTVGTEFLRHAYTILRGIDDAITSVQDLTNLKCGRVVVACASTFSTLVMPEIIARYESLHPNILIEIYDVDDQKVLNAVRAGIADVGITTLVDAKNDLQQILLSKDHYVAILPIGHALEKHQRLSWRMLEGHPFIATREGTPVRAMVNNVIASQMIDLTIAHEVFSVTTLNAMVSAGLGISAVPEIIFKCANQTQVLARPLFDPIVERKICLVTRAFESPSPATADFINFLRKSISEVVILQ